MNLVASEYEILKKPFNTVANCVLSEKFNNFHDIVVGRDSSKLQNFNS